MALDANHASGGEVFGAVPTEFSDAFTPDQVRRIIDSGALDALGAVMLRGWRKVVVDEVVKVRLREDGPDAFLLHYWGFKRIGDDKEHDGCVYIGDDSQHDLTPDQLAALEAPAWEQTAVTGKFEPHPTNAHTVLVNLPDEIAPDVAPAAARAA